MVLQQHAEQGQGHVALPGQQGHIGPEGNHPHHNDPPAPADEDNTKPMYSSYKKV